MLTQVIYDCLEVTHPQETFEALPCQNNFLSNMMNLSVNVMMTMILEIIEPFSYFLYSIFKKLMKSFGFP